MLDVSAGGVGCCRRLGAPSPCWDTGEVSDCGCRCFSRGGALMSRRQRRARENAARLKTAAARVLRRRARRSGGKPVATAAVAALTMVGFGVSTAAASTAGAVETGPESIRGVGVGVPDGRQVQRVAQEPLRPQGAAVRRFERRGLRTL